MTRLKSSRDTIPRQLMKGCALIALRAVNAPKVARVGGLDGEEDWWAPDSVPLPQIADAGGGSVEVFQILYDV